jgi:hypothetical protein
MGRTKTTHSVLLIVSNVPDSFRSDPSKICSELGVTTIFFQHNILTVPGISKRSVRIKVRIRKDCSWPESDKTRSSDPIEIEPVSTTLVVNNWKVFDLLLDQNLTTVESNYFILYLMSYVSMFPRDLSLHQNICSLLWIFLGARPQSTSTPCIGLPTFRNLYRFAIVRVVSERWLKDWIFRMLKKQV